MNVMHFQGNIFSRCVTFSAYEGPYEDDNVGETMLK